MKMKELKQFIVKKENLYMLNTNDNKKAAAKAALQGYLEAAHGIDTCCPFRCLNPAHEDRHPSMAFDKRNNRCVCFACGAKYDIFDIVGIDYNITNTAKKFRKTYQLLSLMDGGDCDA
jgi:replicative DNA helicase